MKVGEAVIVSYETGEFSAVIKSRGNLAYIKSCEKDFKKILLSSGNVEGTVYHDMGIESVVSVVLTIITLFNQYDTNKDCRVLIF